jgi:hypothetical protein
MSLSQKRPDATYLQAVIGTWGVFETEAGRVDFLEAKARLGRANASAEHRLTTFLSRVREALPIGDLDFNQLLQRDLDDHRVAVDLVPYLLTPALTGPAFFPPVVAALLPFEGPLPRDSFPPASPKNQHTDQIGNWERIRFGEAFQFEKLVYDDGSPHDIRAGRLSWNPEAARLVVIDGQHRAMAVLAIERTVNRRWTGSAEKYKSFYESAVNECLDKLPPEQRERVFRDLELPVTVTWFPELGAGSQQKAARKVFVDLNKNARPPSESRILLLSDSELVNIFTRSTLNELRKSQTNLPIYAVEYDHPEGEQAVASKWSVISNVSILAQSVRRIVMGPDRYVDEMESKFGGRENESQMGIFLRKSLNVTDVLEEVIEEGKVYRREEISNLSFPPSKLPVLEKQYLDGWGSLILYAWSQLLPFRAHAEALKVLKDGWSTADASATLAKDAIFEGVGIYWTLKESEAHWRERNQLRHERGETGLPKGDVVNAWEITQKKRDEFNRLRALEYLGSARQVEASEAAFAIFSTAACQIGLFLAVRAISRKMSLQFDEIPSFAKRCIDGANAALKARPLVLVKSDSVVKRKRFNLLGKLDTPYAAYFRYFWLELLNTAEARSSIGDELSQHVMTLVPIARKQYRDHLIAESVRIAKKQNPDWGIEKLRDHAIGWADKHLGEALEHWFGIPRTDDLPPSTLPGPGS